ncbi:MAG TPA: peptidylprolyl isomerase, partial [Chitinophagaceae bacterium]|nr:peptidylprolyl isomerase [Chitinophagaceae bacterium]
MKKWILLAALGSGLQAPAQTLFTYGTDSVSVQEFLQAWKKNNGGKASAADRRAYLDLYIASKLKVKEARALGFDTLAQLNADLDNLRGQLLPAYLTDTTLVEGLVREAAARAAKDIHLQHIFISFTGRNGQADTAGAEQRVTAAVRALKGGASFETVARQYSDDPAAAANGGDIGFITVFTLPYFLENLAYGTPEGAVSDQLRSRSGYHIFRNAGTRPALGRVKAAQILLALPPGAGEKEEAALRRRADSLYARLLKGDDFARLAAAFSNDYVSAAANGQLPEFGVGQYDPLFESTVFSLGNGKISRPFRTAHGYHIVKKIAAVPPPVNGKDASVRAALKSRVEGSDRMEQVGVAFAARVQQQVTVRPEPFSAPALWTLTDSLLAGQPAPALPVGPATPLVQVGRQAYTAADWVEYARTARFRPDGSGLRPYEEVWKDFLQRSAMDYYRAHLEDYNEAFRAQLAEFRDGNLFFEIM